jgi:gamma-glutamylcyclotransferase (GGCT)/AIG2-like uncharacterized protein YtfP
MYSVFTYGTLQIPEVMQAVVGREVASSPASLLSYRRHKIKNQVFPGLSYQPAAETAETLYTKMSAAELDLLDAFEADFYTREVVQAEVKGVLFDAFVYVMAANYQYLLLDEDWDRREFEQLYLPHYLERIEED